MSALYGWRGHSAFFNTKQYGFPEPVGENSNGEALYDREEVEKWDKERPLPPPNKETHPPLTGI